MNFSKTVATFVVLTGIQNFVFAQSYNPVYEVTAANRTAANNSAAHREVANTNRAAANTTAASKYAANKPAATHRDGRVEVGIQYPQTSYPSLLTSIARRRSRPATVTLQPNDDLMGMINSANGNVLIDFFADWCGPCHVQSAILDEMKSTVAKHDGLVIKINVDQHRTLAQRLRVESLPTLMVIRDGKVIERRTGIADHRAIAGFLVR